MAVKCQVICSEIERPSRLVVRVHDTLKAAPWQRCLVITFMPMGEHATVRVGLTG